MSEETQVRTAHSFFYEKKMNHGHRRFCKLCWPDESQIPVVLTGTKSFMKQLPGCVLDIKSSGAMQRHLRGDMHRIETVAKRVDGGIPVKQEDKDATFRLLLRA